MTNEEYVEELENFIKKLLEPIKDLPFSILIKGITDFSVLSFNKKEAEKSGFLTRLKHACSIACNVAYNKGIEAKRINEVGNYIEPFMREALNSVGMKAQIPIAKDGTHKSSGYPDIYAEDVDGTSFYLECKTYNKNNIDSTFRSFYVSPSPNPKITKDALHLMVGFEIVREERSGKNLFAPVYWKLYSLESLNGQIKHEFNASNKDLYSLETKLGEGDYKGVKISSKKLEDFV